MITIAQIHPILVHFPIALLIIAVFVDMILLLIKRDLSARQCLPMVALSVLLLGTLSAYLAAFFGDIAKDNAISLGFPSGPLEIHETMATITMVIFSLYSLLRLLALWRKYPLRGAMGWLAMIPGILGLILLIITAYYGGELVYHYGVNVAPVVP